MTLRRVLLVIMAVGTAMFMVAAGAIALFNRNGPPSTAEEILATFGMIGILLMVASIIIAAIAYLGDDWIKQ